MDVYRNCGDIYIFFYCAHCGELVATTVTACIPDEHVNLVECPMCTTVLEVRATLQLTVKALGDPTCAHCGQRVTVWRIPRPGAPPHTCTFTCCGQQQEQQLHT